MNSIELAQLLGLKHRSLCRRHHKRAGSKRHEPIRLRHLRGKPSRATSKTTEIMRQLTKKSLQFSKLLVAAVAENKNARMQRITRSTKKNKVSISISVTGKAGQVVNFNRRLEC